MALRLCLRCLLLPLLLGSLPPSPGTSTICDDTDAGHAESHPAETDAKVLTEVVLGRKDDRLGSVYVVPHGEGERIQIPVVERGEVEEGWRDVDDDPA